jgi:TonB family protein
MLEVTIDEKGAVTDVRVIKGHPVFADAAVDAVGQWRYEPAMADGMPVSVSFDVEIGFLRDESVRTSYRMAESVVSNQVIFANNDLSTCRYEPTSPVRTVCPYPMKAGNTILLRLILQRL